LIESKNITGLTYICQTFKTNKMLKIIVPIIVGIAFFLFSIIYVDSWIVSAVYHLLGGTDQTQYAVLVKLIVWAVVLCMTIGLAFFMSLGVGVLLGLLMDAIDDGRSNKKYPAARNGR